ncbi:DUF6247 family protein [Tsukamurella soli]|uniref:Uncharacterized protein n=1 Tax=Tsukamurella soli TaxID=644556 RepID=A0ABP8J6H2_9ACTN
MSDEAGEQDREWTQYLSAEERDEMDAAFAAAAPGERADLIRSWRGTAEAYAAGMPRGDGANLHQYADDEMPVVPRPDDADRQILRELLARVLTSPTVRRNFSRSRERGTDTLRPILVHDDDGWVAALPSVPVAAAGATREEAAIEMVSALRAYAVRWHAELQQRPGHERHSELVAFIDESGDDMLRDWTLGDDSAYLLRSPRNAARLRAALALPGLLGTADGADVDFEPERLGLTARTADLNEDVDAQPTQPTKAARDLERTGPSIRAVLADVAPDDLPEFEAEFRTALAEADDDFDLSRVDAVINRWWGRAHLRLHPPTDAEQAAVARVETGDDSGIHTPGD